MSYDLEDNWFESEDEYSSDVIGFGDIGGVGQLIYHTVRFEDYKNEQSGNGNWCLKPIGKAVVDKEGGYTGKQIVESLYNLGLQINDFAEKKPFDELIIDFCKMVAHPYFIDSLYETITDPAFSYLDDSEMLANDAMFSTDEFMHDLGSFYTAAQFFFALKNVINGIGNGDDAFNLALEGKFFEGLPFFEKYKHEDDGCQYVPDREPISKEALLDEMMKDTLKPEQYEEGDWFAREPIDNIDALWAALIDLIPDFHIRLKMNPKNNKVVFAADVHSVFDIAWYTLARMIADFGVTEEGNGDKNESEGTIVTCLHCGKAFIRRNNRQQYCKKTECQNAHNALRQRRYRENKKVKDAQSRKKQQ